jgi:hypothetical protein
MALRTRTRRGHRAVEMRTAARWRDRPRLAGGQGVPRPAGTPQGSGGGCVRQGGAAGLSLEMLDGDGAEKTVRRGGGSKQWRNSGGRGGRSRGPIAGGGDEGGEAWSKRD